MATVYFEWQQFMMETSVEIRRLDEKGIDVFRQMRLEALFNEPRSFASSYEDWQALPKKEWGRRLSENAVFVALKQGLPVGMMGLMRQKPSKMTHRASLIMVYVQKCERGAGVAVDLLRAVEQYALDQEIYQLELNASAENPAAINFYMREGFSEIGRIPAGFIHDGEEVDDILMVRRLERL